MFARAAQMLVSPILVLGCVATLLLGQSPAAYAEGESSSTSTDYSNAYSVLYATGSDPLVVGYAENENFQVLRYDANGKSTIELDRHFDPGTMVTALAMAADNLLAVGNSAGRIELYEKQADGEWESAFNVFYEREALPKISCLSFGGINYLAHGTDAGDFEVYSRPLSWDHATPWTSVLSRVYTDGEKVTAITMNEAGWMVNGTDTGYVALWKPGPEEYGETYHWTLADDGLSFISSIAMGGNDHVAFGTDWGEYWRYTRNPDDTYIETLSIGNESMAGITALALTANGMLAVGDDEGFVEAFSAEASGSFMFSSFITEETGPVHVVSFSEHGTRLFGRGYRYHQGWKLIDGKWQQD